MALLWRLFSRSATRCLALVALASIVGTQPVDAQYLPAEAGVRQYEELQRIYRSRHEKREGARTDEDIFGRDAWFNYQRSFPLGTIPANGRVDAIRATEAMQQALERSWRINGRTRSLLAATQWEPIGPTNQGGRIRAIAIHPSSSGEILVGAAAGGVWKTTDGGGTWRPTFDRESAIAVGSLAYDYSNPAIVYAGTGENFPSSPTLLINTPSYLGNGVFKSTDGGETWKSSGLESAGAVSKLFVHRRTPSVIYAAVARENGGFYRSTDAGATWTLTVSGNFYDMSVNPQNSDEVYIAQASGVQRSSDGGLTFTRIASGMNTDSGVRFSVAVAPSSPTHVYALGARRGGDAQVAEVYKSTDRGSSWRLLRTFDPMFFNGQGVYDNFIVVDPANANVVLAGGIDVYRTSDGGDGWTNVTRSYAGGNVHPDQHVAEFDPSTSGVVVLGNDGGVYVSLDGGSSWGRSTDGLAVTQFYRMEVDQTRPFRVYGGTQDNGTSGSFGTTGFTGDWRGVLGGDGFFVQADLGDPNYFYAEIYYGALFRINANNPSQVSRVDRGIPSTGPNADEGNWATPIAMSPADRVSLYSGRTNLWRTTDRGGVWTKIPVGVGTKLAAIGLSPSDANDIVVGSVSGLVRYSTDYGATWASASGLPGSCVTDLRFDPVAPERVYATFSGFGSAHVFRSDSYGAQWVNITANLPKIPVNAIAIDPDNPSHLFVATDVGAFFSPSGGDYWIPFNPGLPLAPISDLRIHRSSRSLIAATHGRSMFRVSLDAIELEPTLVQPIGGERITTPGPLEIRWFGFTGPVNVSIRYSADEPFQIVAAGVTDDHVIVDLPMRMSSTARVRVEEIGTGRTVSSGFLTLVTPANATALGKRGFVAEAIELRGSTLWATSRGTDDIYRLRLPLLTGATTIVRSGFTGSITDLAFDAARDEFIVLVTDEGFSSPRIHRMDTTGRSLGEIAIPSELTTAVGITVQGDALAVATAGPTPELWLLDPSTGEQRGRSVIADAGSADRRGLVWNGRAFVQAAMSAGSAGGFDAELQQISSSMPARVVDRIAIVATSGNDMRLVGLAHDPGTSGVEYYFATDTSGQFYRFRADILGGADDATALGASSLRATATVRPNPAVADATLELRLDRAAALRVTLVDAGGSSVADVIERIVEPGEARISLPIGMLASGMYYVVVESGDDRVVRPLSVVR